MTKAASAALDASRSIMHNPFSYRPFFGCEQLVAVWEPGFDCTDAPAGDREVAMSDEG